MKKSVLNKKAKKHTTKGLLKNKLGMTYVELITALGLLALIITSFTPMLLSSYETLYDAGVKVQEVYNSKEEMEEGLARRDSEKSASVKLNLKVNADAVFNNMNISGRKIISTFREGLETVFGQVRPRIEIVSPSTVYDDATSHNIILQTFGLEYKKITFGAFNYDTTNNAAAANKMPADQIHIQVIAPNKSAKKTDGTADENMIGTDDGLVYGSGRFCELEYFSSKFTSKNIPSDGLKISNDDNSGRIKLKIKSPATGDKLDFTYSPLKIQVYYINSRGHLKTVSEYLNIDPATIIAAGETAPGIDYYTSAGIEAINISEDDDEKLIEYQLKAEARKMRTSNSAYLNNKGAYLSSAVGSPSDNKVEIHSIRWIDNDQTQGVNPYFVMTGTNGSIYRMYTFNSDKSDTFDEAMGATIKNTSTGFFNVTQNYIDRVYTTTTGRRIYPALWGGDYSHIYEYTSAQRRVAYGTSVNNYPGAGNLLNTSSDTDETWLTSAKSTITYKDKKYTVERAGLAGDPIYNVMSPVAQFCYYYNGDGTKHDFASKNMRNISYILTERGRPLRLFGVVKEGGIFNGSSDDFREFYAIWDTVNLVPGTTETNYWKEGVRDTTHPWMNQIYAFLYKDPDGTTQNDYTLSGIRIKSLGSYDLSLASDSSVDYLDPAEDNNYSTSMEKVPNVAGKDMLGGQSYDIDVTDAIYIPGTSKTEGSTFYVGSVNAFANIVQTNRVSEARAYKNDDHGKDGGYKNYQNFWGTNKNCYPRGVTTDFLIFADDDAKATYIAKYDDSESNINDNTNGYNRDGYETRKNILNFCTDYVRNNCVGIEDLSTSAINKLGLEDGSVDTARAEFFFPNLQASWKYIYLEDTKFTFGYASNREKVYTNITYDGETELIRSFERLYWRSHYGQDAYGSSAQDAFYGNALTVHTQNRVVCDKDGKIVKTDEYGYQYTNSAENDYYNVWFPGEMYNLRKVASKDGITVAVGYAVAGSAYQYINPDSASRTSTALGGLYNDGVLSAMIEGKDDAFVNLLYFKDNATFDGTSYSGKTFYTSNDSTFGTYSSYGTHARDSVQFTAVDLVVENIKESETAENYNIEYYAYYGDSKGRVFRSLIATGSGSGDSESESNAGDLNVELVPFIKDTTFSNQTNATNYTVGGRNIPYAGMDEVLVNGKSLGTIFSKIVTIDAMDDLVIITGEMASGGEEYIVVGVRNPDTGAWTYRAVKNCGFTSVINDATIVGGYYYIVGDGWMAGVMLDVLRDTNVTTLSTPSLTNENIGCKSTDPNKLLWCNTSVDLYAIAGRDTH